MLYNDYSNRSENKEDFLLKALELFDKGLEYDKNYIWAHHGKGWIFFKLGDITNDKSYYKKSIEEFNKVLKIDKYNETARDGIRFCNEKL